MKKKEMMILIDEKYISYKNNKIQSKLINETFSKKENKNIFVVSTTNKSKLKKKISIINLIKNFFLVRDKLEILKDLSILLKSKDLRLEVKKNGLIFYRSYIFSIIRSFIIIINFFKIFKESSKKYESLCTVCYYNSMSLSAIVAFRSNQKKIIELQHASINNHDAYPKKNSSYFKNAKILKPDEIILWSNEEKIKSKYLKISFSKYPQIKSEKLKRNKKIKIIGYSLSGVEYTRPINKNLIFFIKKYKNIKWSFRFHPMRNDLSFYKHADFFKQVEKCKNVKFIKADTSLDNWLHGIDIHISHNSSVFIEAAINNVQSITFNPKSVNWFGNLVKKKQLIIVKKSNYEKVILNKLIGN